ncbi:alpha/beta fold hydrolase [Hymenobacter sp. HMF4947]|uniref:Alpha/beta fold hydrolase n=1 Tax=Hymenobacter ginkgonis TaxID=2682976 RepID=A0A7K1TH78_9BACT|nr:alpha/beta fold hydrolase [Hymenobacter ginkgonis]
MPTHSFLSSLQSSTKGAAGVFQQAFPVPSKPVRLGVLEKLNVNVVGGGKPTLLFCNGFNCNQHIWNYLRPRLAVHYHLVFFDQMGTGDSDLTAYEAEKYSTLEAYAQDVIEVCEALSLHDVVLIGHSVGAMIGLLAANRAPAYFSKVVLMAVSPCYINEPGYYGGFERQDLLDLLAAMDDNYQSWASTFATMLMGQDQPAALGYELAGYFCQADPTIARRFARLSFLADNRADVAQLPLPALLLQCREDVAVPDEVTAYLQAQLPQATLITLNTTGHCPHLSAPLEVLAALQEFLA